MSCYEYPWDCGICPYFLECFGFLDDPSELDPDGDWRSGGDDDEE